MKHMAIKLFFTFCVSTLLISIGCKREFLDAKPSTDILQPVTISEFQKLLDNSDIINTTVALGVLSSDEFIFTSDATWQSTITPKERNCYIWSKDLYEGEDLKHWNLPYSAIFYANNVLAGLEKIPQTTTNLNEWKITKGRALFIRAFSFYELVNNFAPIYDENKASNDLGIPLRLEPSIDQILQRASVQECYDRILMDLKQATPLLEANIPAARSRPSKAAAHALFSRIYLTMRKYDKAELHADSSLKYYDKLLDYNLLSKTSANPFAYNHDEQIYAKSGTSELTYSGSANNTYIQMSPQLTRLYSANDLRLTIYYTKQSDGSYKIKRGYGGSGNNPFVGLATDEVYLIKAECAARNGDANGAMDKLNQLLVKRWNPNATSPAKLYQNISASDPTDALNKVLLERRKELVWRGLRWDDLKRYNKEGANITLNHTIKGQTYTLLPNDARYIFPIPDNEIGLSGIQQNQR